MTVTPPNEIRRFCDDEGRLRAWPARRKFQLVALHFLAEQFPRGEDWSEKQVNERLNGLHTFGDWALLRRELFDLRLLGRESDGSRYWRTGP
jgi:hypothetical protein